MEIWEIFITNNERLAVSGDLCDDPPAVSLIPSMESETDLCDIIADRDRRLSVHARQLDDHVQRIALLLATQLLHDVVRQRRGDPKSACAHPHASASCRVHSNTISEFVRTPHQHKRDIQVLPQARQLLCEMRVGDDVLCTQRRCQQTQ